MKLTEDEEMAIAMSGVPWIRLLKRREENLIGRMHGEFRSGNTTQVGNLAELACIRDQIHEINSIIKIAESKRGKA